MDQTPIVSLAGGHPLIDIDATVLVQFVLFLVLFVVANRLLFQPYLKLRERRRAGIEGGAKARREAAAHEREVTDKARAAAQKATDEAQATMQRETEAARAQLM